MLISLHSGVGFQQRLQTYKKEDVMYNVSEKIKKQTVKCKTNYSCLTTGKCGNSEMCTVKDCDGLNVLFVTQNTADICPYNVSFGDGLICSCPTRYEIYIRYNK